MKYLTIPLLITLISSCAKHPDKIKAQYISPIVYSEYSCAQITLEIQRLNSRISELYGSQKNASTKSNVATGVGAILFWPALFFIDSNSEQASEYSRLKGEYDALEQAAIQKNCNIK